MTVKDIAKIICVEGTESENRNIDIMSIFTGEILWNGKAKDLKDQHNLDNYGVCEILVDSYDKIKYPKIPEYNLGKVITVY